jgi:hypothetical protein
MSYIFYNKSGSLIAYTEDNCHIFKFTGEPLAYINEDSVYTYEGKHLGFYQGGWIRDNDGMCVYFTKDAKGGPPRKMKEIGPVKSPKSKIPEKKPRNNQLKKPEIKQVWSKLSLVKFFEH